MILVLVVEGVYFLKLRGERRGKQQGLTETQRIAEDQSQFKEESIADIGNVSFLCPVDEEYCNKAEEIGHYLGFQLPSGTEIRAVMPGNVSLSKNNFGDTVIELRSVSGSRVFYILRLPGPQDSLELPRQSVEMGDILGKSGGLTQFSLRHNLLVSFVDEKSNYYPKPKELFGL